MRVALLTTFAAGKKEPLASVVERIHQAFVDAGLGEPFIRFNFGDSPILQGVSSVDRVLKRHAELERFVTTESPMPGISGARRISNGPMSPSAGESIPFATLLEITAGVPRSFPFHNVAVHFHAPLFGEIAINPRNAEGMAGVLVTDSWWVNGRNRSVSACTIVEADPSSKKLPPHPEPVAAVLAACGKAKKTVQAPVPGAEVGAGPVPGVRLPTGVLIPSADPEAARAVHAVVVRYRQLMRETIAHAAMPHTLPLQAEAFKEFGAAGPKKPALEAAFQPMGYSCRGGSGTFSLRRKTDKHLTVELHLDVGTWSHSIVAMFHVFGVGFKATLLLPVSPDAPVGGQYPIGDAERWKKIVENLAALVAELDRSFVVDVEAAAGPSPEWYEPES